MILTDRQIRNAPCVQPFNPHNVNPASYDLTLGNLVRRPRWFWRNPLTRRLAWTLLRHPTRPDLLWTPARAFDRLTLWPGDFVLCHSHEVTAIPTNVVALLFSKSSVGRLGIEHLHAGYGDPGFVGQWTFELVNNAPWPVTLRPGQRLMQLAFVQTETPDLDYSQTGRYQGQRGPTGARTKSKL